MFAVNREPSGTLGQQHRTRGRVVAGFGQLRRLDAALASAEVVTIVLVGEKRGDSLLVQGVEFTAHESDPAE